MTTELTFGAWLRLRRRQLDLTQKELADNSNCSVVTIRKIEQGDRRPSKQLAELMAVALQMPAEQVTNFIAYARQDPDSTQMPFSLQGQGQNVVPTTMDAETMQAMGSRLAENDSAYTLPRPTTLFLGREAEIETLLDYLQDPHQQLVSILGPGGMGKTRLALAVAERLTAEGDHPFYDGIVFIPLAALTEHDQIAPAVADGLAILVDGRRRAADQLLAYLAQRRLLLIVDNCEHLLDGIGLLVEIVQNAPGVTVLATSRERLHLQGEQAYPIDGLSALDFLDPSSDTAMDHPAVRLFLQSAQRAAPTFALTAADLPQVAHICKLVDGIPLGIELSAGWVGMMSLSEIADEVQQNLDFLSSDFRDLPARHRSMRAVFDASWQHLDPIEQSVFRQLTVFRGGFTRQAAADVVGASLRHLGHLIYKSLLHYDRAHNRYWLHELLHQYGEDQLSEHADEAKSAETRHCDYFIERLIACSDLLRGEDQVGALAELDADVDNFRLAWRTAISSGEAARLRPAMDTLGFYLEWRVHSDEGHSAFQRLVVAIDAEESDEARKTLIRALAWQASFLRQLGQPDAAIDLLDQAETLCHHPSIDEQTRRFELAFIAYQRGYCLERRQNDRALDCFRKSVELWEAYGDPWWVALGLGGLGFNLSWSNHFIEAKLELSRSVEIFERFGHTRELVFLHNRLCDSCIFKGEMKAARHHAERALGLAEQAHIRAGQADALRNLAVVSNLHDNRLEDAERLNNDALTLYRSLGVQIGAALSIAAKGTYQLMRGHVEDGRHYYLEAMDLFQAQQLRQGVGYILHWQSIVDAMSGEWIQAKVKIEESIEIFREVGAYNFIPRLEVIRFLVDKEALPPKQACDWLTDMLQNALAIDEFFDIYWSLSAMSYVLLVERLSFDNAPLPRPVVLAAEIRGFVSENLEYGQSAFMHTLVYDEVEAMLSLWPQQAIDSARARGRGQDIWAFAEHVLDAITQFDLGVKLEEEKVDVTPNSV